MAGDVNPVRDELRGVYRQIHNALATQDIAAFMALLAPDVIIKAVNGSVATRDGFQLYLQHLFAIMESLVEFDITFEQLEITPNGVLVTYTEHAQAVMLNQAGYKYMRATLGRERALWVETAQGWQLALAEGLGAVTIHIRNLVSAEDSRSTLLLTR